MFLEFKIFFEEIDLYIFVSDIEEVLQVSSCHSFLNKCTDVLRV